MSIHHCSDVPECETHEPAFRVGGGWKIWICRKVAENLMRRTTTTITISSILCSCITMAVGRLLLRVTTIAMTPTCMRYMNDDGMEDEDLAMVEKLWKIYAGLLIDIIIMNVYNEASPLQWDHGAASWSIAWWAREVVNINVEDYRRRRKMISRCTTACVFHFWFLYSTSIWVLVVLVSLIFSQFHYIIVWSGRS